MTFRETTSFAYNSIKIDVCVTSGAVRLTDWMALDIPCLLFNSEKSLVYLARKVPRPSPMSTQCEPPPRVY